jgi:hypothetical protein
MQEKVHGAEASGGINDFDAAQGVELEGALFFGVPFFGVMVADVIVAARRKPPVPAAHVAVLRRPDYRPKEWCLSGLSRITPELPPLKKW